MRARRPLVLAAALGVLPLLALPAGAATTTDPGPPVFVTSHAPQGEADEAGEPSVGSNWKSGAAMYQAYTQTYKITYADPAAPGITWADVSNPNAVTSLDPILWTDSTTGRTVESQLLAACSAAAYTDDDGGTWSPSQGCGLGTAFDHQTIGGGPYADPKPPTASYPHAVYYCAQYVASANCARSDDGGATFGPGVPIYNTPLNDGAQTPLTCAGLHGHLRVAPDGSAYVPNFDCFDQNGDSRVAVSVSADNGTTWSVRPVAQSTTQDESDPSVSAGSGGTLYLGWEEGGDTKVGSKPYAAVSRDHGRTWTNVTDVGKAFGVSNVQFPEVIAGDDDRAAFAFLGSTTGGDDQKGGETDNPAKQNVFPGVWHLYVALTYDGGQTWTTQDLTPDDPVQRGCIWLQGGGGSCRNLLDFNDITVDKTGRVLIGWADGCVGRCATTDIAAGDDYNSTQNAPDYRAQKGAVSVQTGGKGLFAAYDGQLGAAVPGPDVPEAPTAVLLPVAGAVLLGAVLLRRRRGSAGAARLPGLSPLRG